MEQKQKRDEKELDYTTAIKKIFKDSDSTYGVDRICGCLRKCGYTASYQRVKRIMDKAKLLKKHGILQSFSRAGKPGDNAWSESYFAKLKKEAVHWRHFRTRDEARQAIFAYTEGFYNTRRVQKRLRYLSPLEWLNNHYMLVSESVA